MATKTAPLKVQQIRNLTDSTYVLRFDRGGMKFTPGQYVSVGVRGDINMREYSIYSKSGADYLEILIREVEHGVVSKRLRRLSPGDELDVDGPFGFFLIEPQAIRERQFLFVATGTGISPFHSFVGSHPDLDYCLLHGVRHRNELYEHHAFSSNRVVSCISREEMGSSGAVGDSKDGPALRTGRVTDYLDSEVVNPDTLCYICGNCDMIYQVFDILKSHGVPPEQLYAEVYF
jgi:ferredoxin--NADP+ reductase